MSTISDWRLEPWAGTLPAICDAFNLRMLACYETRVALHIRAVLLADRASVLALAQMGSPGTVSTSDSKRIE
jgi:hypothetical protein